MGRGPCGLVSMVVYKNIINAWQGMSRCACSITVVVAPVGH